MQRLPDESERAIDKGYGNKQLRPLEIALSARSNEIRRLLQKMELLSGKVEAAAVDEEVED